MKIEINRDVFSEAVSFAARILSQRTALPILSGILLTAENDQLTISTYDYEASSQITVQAAIDTPGQILVSGRLLNEIASKLPQATVSIDAEENKVLVKAGSAKFHLALMPVGEYPQIPEVSGEAGKVRTEDFIAAISQVTVAASRDDVTPVITGVQLEISENRLDVIATDRYRVAVRSLDWDGQINEGSALIPARILQEVGKSFSHSEIIEIVISQESENKIIAFRAGTKTVTSLLIKGNFPPVKRLFPEDVSNHAVLNTAELIEATRRVQTVLERDAALRFNFSTDGLMLEAAGSEHAQASEVVDALLTGDEVVVSLKPQFLIDGLSSVHSEFVRIGFTKTDNPNKPGPVLITPQTSRESSEVEGYRYLLQPNLLVR